MNSSQETFSLPMGQASSLSSSLIVKLALDEAKMPTSDCDSTLVRKANTWVCGLGFGEGGFPLSAAMSAHARIKLNPMGMELKFLAVPP